MKECFCVVIDDTTRFVNSTFLSTFQREIRKSHKLQVEFEQLNPKDAAYIDEEGRIDISKVIADLQTPKYLKRAVHLVICDYGLGDDRVNGFEVIRKLRSEIKTKKKIILYSSNIDNVIMKILNDGQESERIARLKDLFSSQISSFCERDSHLTNSILEHLQQETEYTTDRQIVEALYRYGSRKFSAAYDKFENMQLAEVADILEKHDHERERFEKEIIDQIIGYLVGLENE